MPARAYMLDTNTVSYIVRGQSALARRKLRETSTRARVCISAITEAEVRYGLAKRSLSKDAQDAIEQFLLNIDVLAWDSDAAQAYGSLRAQLEVKATPLGNMDLLIAAHAIAAGAVLVTNDQAFSHARGKLVTTNWV